MPHVTFVHGIGNKVGKGALEASWVDVLREADGLDLAAEGVSTSLCYWADLLYAEPLPDAVDTDEAFESLGDAELVEAGVAGEAWFRELPPDQQRDVLELAAEVGAGGWITDPDGRDDPTADPDGVGFERVPLPGPLKQLAMKAFLRDVHHYLWNVESGPRPGERYRVRDAARQRALDALGAAADADPPHVVVAHSLGSVIVYDVLQHVADAPAVDGLLTLGSPLGLDEVQDRLAPGWSRWDGFPAGRCRGPWVNVYDRLDPVCGFDPVLANDFRRAGRPVVTDVHEANWGSWRHSAVKYLSRPRLRRHLADLLGV